ncbi:MAG: DPP IV N-terminal domain-containing protein, partial [Leeuwenhoekiella sp.]
MSTQTNRYFLLFFFLLFTGATQIALSQTSTLSVEKIMQDPQWMGTFPSDVQWGPQSETVYFDYNPEKHPADSLYKISVNNQGNIEKVSLREKRNRISSYGTFNPDKSKKLFTEDGALYIYDVKNNSKKQLLELDSRIQDPAFMTDEDQITFTYSNNAYQYHLKEGNLHRLTNIQEGKAPTDKEKKQSEKEDWLKDENLELLKVVREREENEEKSEAYNELLDKKDPFAFYLEDRSLSNMAVASNGKFITFNLITRERGKSTGVPNYVDASGYTTDLNARNKVGDEETKVELAIYNVKKDTVYMAKTDDLPGIKDLPDYVKDYPDKEWKEDVRDVILSNAYFSPDGEKAIVNVRSKDNKDRWIAEINFANGSLKSLDRQRDEAWIAGPGIGWTFGGGTMGWLPDNKHIYFQSEATGYSHLYLLNV